MKLQHPIQATIRPDPQSGWVAECAQLRAVTQGETLDEVTRNLQEVVALMLDGEDLHQLGLTESPVIVATLELEVEPAVA